MLARLPISLPGTGCTFSVLLLLLYHSVLSTLLDSLEPLCFNINAPITHTIIQKEQGAHRKRKGTLNLQTFFQLQNKNNPTQGGMFMSPKEGKCATYVQMLWTFHHIFPQSRVHNPGLLPQSIMSTWNLWCKLHPFLPARAKRQVWWTLLGGHSTIVHRLRSGIVWELNYCYRFHCTTFFFSLLRNYFIPGVGHPLYIGAIIFLCFNKNKF